VQGIGSVGVAPAVKGPMRERLAAQGIAVPDMVGLDTLGCIEAAHAGKFKNGWALGGNLYGANPDAGYAREALARLDLLVYLNTSLNTGHAHGLGKETLILPVLARDEEPYKTTQESMFNFVRLSDGGERRLAGPRGEVEIVCAVAARVLGETTGKLKWRELVDTAKVRALIADVVPGFGGVKTMDATKQEFTVAGRVLAEGKFPTPSGKAILHAHPVPKAAAAADELTLMTLRSEGQFNTVVFEDHDLYRGQDRRDVVLLNPEDMRRLGLLEEQLVEVESSVGKMRGIRARAFAVAAGSAVMYYPESNVLVPRIVDPRSLTPTFKAVPVKIRAMGGVAHGAGAPSSTARSGGGVLGAMRRVTARRRRAAMKSC
jgi:anaerobic selenocysteine-containing dehydrogenase